MNGAFLDAVQRKDLGALTALVAPTFLWTVSGQPADELDVGRDAKNDAGTLVCCPMAAEVADDNAFDQAAARSTRSTSRSNGISPSLPRRRSPRRPATSAPPSPRSEQWRCRYSASIRWKRKARLRRRRPISRCCCRPAAPAGCPSRPCARSRRLTSATRAPR
jgi:hypothetical protein